MKTYIDYLEKTANLYFNKKSFEDDQRSASFGDIQKESKSIATALINMDLYKQPILVIIDKSVDCISAMMGVGYSGNFYCPVDVKMPVDRLEKIIDTLGTKTIIIRRSDINKYKQQFNHIDFVLFEDAIETSVDERKIAFVGEKVVDTDVAYVLFTSGSTGNPKGVTISHRALISYIEWVSVTFNFDDMTVFGNQTPFYFSMSVLDIFCTIRCASTMIILPKKVFSFPLRLVDTLIEKKVNTLYWVPTALGQVANSGVLEKRNLECIRTILFAGEVMPAKYYNIWKNMLNHEVVFANLFGPTEVTDICTYYIVDREISDDEAIPIGKACENADIFLLDESNCIVTEPEVMGEMCVRGSILAYGYYNNPSKTKEVFVQNPVNTMYSEIVYRTGDIVHYNKERELMYDTRKDFQIKHLGHRIELGEIETVAMAVVGVYSCCCVYDKDRQTIVLFYSGDADDGNISKEIINKLPVYMRPRLYIRLKNMPTNANGKIDRKLLLANLKETNYE